jgi:hypothetical protein
MWLAPMYALVLLQTPAPAGSWSGEFTLAIKGQGLVANSVINATWKVDRVARGTLVLDRSFRGAGIAGTPNARDTSRYETWVTDRRRPIIMQVNDSGTFYGPLFGRDNIRQDTQRWQCPATGSSSATGQVASAILQLDFQNGTFSFESPRIFARCDLYFRRDFVKGPKESAAKPSLMLENGVDPAFEIIHRLNQPGEWRVITGAFRAGQGEIVLSRTFAFTWPLQTEMFPGGKLEAELVLVLRRAD